MAVDTWFAAHNRRNHLKLGHWNTINNAERKETKAKLKMVKGGMELKDCSKTEFKTPKSIFEVSECLRLKELSKITFLIISFFSNFRSVQSRLWPWDWTPEAMQRLMEDYDYVSKALSKNRGLDFRIRLIELWFNDVTRHNATYPQKRPLTYEEMKSKLVKLLSSNSK